MKMKKVIQGALLFTFSCVLLVGFPMKSMAKENLSQTNEIAQVIEPAMGKHDFFVNSSIYRGARFWHEDSRYGKKYVGYVYYQYKTGWGSDVNYVYYGTLTPCEGGVCPGPYSL